MDLTKNKQYVRGKQGSCPSCGYTLQKTLIGKTVCSKCRYDAEQPHEQIVDTLPEFHKWKY
jgi:uncharacterized Zn finger protein (UPF0148 family)